VIDRGPRSLWPGRSSRPVVLTASRSGTGAGVANLGTSSGRQGFESKKLLRSDAGLLWAGQLL
jgi:hypothetical protein